MRSFRITLGLLLSVVGAIGLSYVILIFGTAYFLDRFNSVRDLTGVGLAAGFALMVYAGWRLYKAR
jgi:Na+/H+-dicarboxylate symporter